MFRSTAVASGSPEGEAFSSCVHEQRRTDTTKTGKHHFINIFSSFLQDETKAGNVRNIGQPQDILVV
jgi:hypothetical protein